MIPIISTKGYRCTLEECVSRRDDYAHLLSLVGTREAVKAIWARLMKGEAAYGYNGSESKTVRMNAYEGSKLLTERLPSGAFHGLILSRALLRGEVLVCEQQENLPARFYRSLTQTSRLPLHSAWKGWLWEHALAQEMLRPLASVRLHAYDVRVNMLELEQAVRVALVEGSLPDIGDNP